MLKRAPQPVVSVGKKNLLSANNVLLIVGIILIGANLRTGVTSVGPLLQRIQQSLDLSAATAGLLSSLPLILFAVFSPIAPYVAGKIGMRRTLGGALLLLFVGLIGRSLPIAGMLWIGSICIGVAIAFVNVILPALVKRYFPQRASALISAYSGIMSVVAAIASGVSVPLAGSSADGWRWSLASWSLLTLITLLVWLPQLKSPVRLSNAQRSAGINSAVSNQVPVRRSPWRSLLGWQIAMFMGLQSFTFYTLIGWYGTYAGSQGIAAERAGLYLSVYQMMAVVANLCMMFFINRSQDQRLVGILCSLLMFIGLSGLIVQPELSLLWLTLAGVGGGMAMVFSLLLFGLRTEGYKQAVALSGMAQSVGYLFAAIGPVTVGIIHDISQSWTLPFVLLACLAVIQMLLSLSVGRNRTIG